MMMRQVAALLALASIGIVILSPQLCGQVAAASPLLSKSTHVDAGTSNTAIASNSGSGSGSSSSSSRCGCTACPTSNLLQVKPRMAAPSWKAKAVVGEKFADVSLADYRGQWLVLFFYPFDFTFVCPTEIIAFSDKVQEFADLNTAVVAVSTDSHHTHLAWVRTPRKDGGVGKLNIPLVSDISKNIAHSYGVLVEDEHDDMYGAALRGLFIIDPNGVIRSIQINDDVVGRSVTETLRLIKAFQFADAHKGEVCPAGWNPGDATIKADPHGAKEFFRKMFDE